MSAPTSEAAGVYAALAKAVDTEVSALATLQLPQLMYASDSGLVLVAMPDGSSQQVTPHEMRRACRSPSNDPDNLPAELAPLDFVPMGNYAVSVRWSDGHQSLLPYRSFLVGYE